MLNRYETSEYNLKKILDDILKQTDKNKEGREYTEVLKELYEFVEELNSEKELVIECPEIEDVIRNYVVEWVVWGIAMRRDDIETQISLLYSSFCFQISNMILGICKLVKEGLDYPAMCLIRVLLEMIMTFLAILIDDNYKEKYFETADVTKEYSIWKKELRIGKTEEIVWKYASSEDEETAKYCKECKNLYEELYKDFSKFDHNSYANMIVMQFALTDDERLNLNVNGNKVSAIERVLKQVLMIVFPLEALFSKVIFEKYAVEYKIPEDEFGQKNVVIWKNVTYYGFGFSAEVFRGYTKEDGINVLFLGTLCQYGGLRILPFVDAMGRQCCAYFVCNNRRILLLSSKFGEYYFLTLF